MEVDVLLFAGARELLGGPHVRLELPDRARVADLRRALAARAPALSPLVARSLVAVNNEYADDSLVIAPDAEVALIPPVSGGGGSAPLAGRGRRGHVRCRAPRASSA